MDLWCIYAEKRDISQLVQDCLTADLRGAREGEVLGHSPIFSKRIFSTFFIKSRAISMFSLFWMARRGLALYLQGRGVTGRKVQEERKERRKGKMRIGR